MQSLLSFWSEGDKFMPGMLNVVHTDCRHNYASHKPHFFKSKTENMVMKGIFEVTSHKFHVGPNRLSCYERLLITANKTKYNTNNSSILNDI